MRSKNAKDYSIYHKMLPIKLPQGANVGEPSSRTFISISMERSGQHALINWLCQNFETALHFNHCCFVRHGMSMEIIPTAGRITIYRNGTKQDLGVINRGPTQHFMSEYRTRLNGLTQSEMNFFSFEDYALENPLLRKLCQRAQTTVILILRDPLNWLASSMSHHSQTDVPRLEAKLELYKTYLLQAVRLRDYLGADVQPVIFNDWVCSDAYRSELLNHLRIEGQPWAQQSLTEVPDFGGGSSFDGLVDDRSELHKNVLERWRIYKNKPLFWRLLRDSDVLNLAKEAFPNFDFEPFELSNKRRREDR